MHEKHYTARTLAEDKATSLEECWPFKEDAVLESTVGRLGSRVRVAEGRHGCVWFAGTFDAGFLEFWALSKDPGFFAPTPRSYAGCSGKVAMAPGHPIFPVFRQFRRACRAVLWRGRYFHRSSFLFPSFVRQDSKQTSTTYQP